MASKVTDDGILNIYVYGEIMTDQSFWFGSEDDVICREFIKDLHAHPNAKRINVYINSGGGEVFAAVTMAQQLKKHKAEVHTYVEGMCASAATLIAMAGDVRHMSISGLYMIHLPSGSFRGNRMDLDKGKEVLSKVEDIIRLTYKEKTTLSDEQLTAMLEHETWLTAEEAYKYGFITDIEQEPEDKIDDLIKEVQNDVVAMNGVQINISAYADQAQLRAKLAELKSKQKGGHTMDFKQFLDSLGADTRTMVENAIKEQIAQATTQVTDQVTNLTDQLTQTTNQLETARAELTDTQNKLAESQAEVAKLQDATAPEDPDAVFLASLPENARTAILDARKIAVEAAAKVVQLEDEKNFNEFKAGLSAYGDLPLQDEHKAALYNISKANPTEYGIIENLFKVANAAMQNNFQAVGTDSESAAPTDDAFAQIEHLVQDKRKADPTLDYNDAFTAVVRENPELYAKYRETM